MKYHIYLVRYCDYWLRLCLHKGGKRQHLKYLRTLGTDIVYLGNLCKPIEYDIDDSGIGTKKLDGFTIISCKHAKMMMTIKQQGMSLTEHQKSFVDKLRYNEEWLM